MDFQNYLFSVAIAIQTKNLPFIYRIVDKYFNKFLVLTCFKGFMVNFVHLRFNSLDMSFSFRLRYFLGLIPKAQKIDSAWAQLLKMRDELESIEASKELSRYLELKQLIQSNDFQNKKRDVKNLRIKGSPENEILTELVNLEKSKPIRNYFRFIQSTDFNRVNTISKSSDLSRYLELKRLVEAPDFITRKKEIESLRYKGSSEFSIRHEFSVLQKSTRLKMYFTTLASDEYRVFLELHATEQEKLKIFSKERELKEKIYHKFLKSNAYKNIKIVDEQALPAKFDQLKRETNTKAFLEHEAFLKNRLRYQTTPDFWLFQEFAKLSKGSSKPSFLRFIPIIGKSKRKKSDKDPFTQRYLELKKIVESPEFIRRKKECESLKYKYSPEYLKIQKYRELQKSSKLKLYNATLTSSEYIVFLELDASEQEKLKNYSKEKELKEKIYYKFLKSKAYKNFVTVGELKLPAKFEQLKRSTNDKVFLEREAFLKNSARFETTPDYPLFVEYERLAKNSDIQFYLKCVKSSLFVNYQEISVSKSLSRLLELRIKVSDQSFKERVSFLKNKKRYETTHEFKLEKEFAELEKSKLITTYHQLKKRSELAFFDQWDIVLDENFSDQKLSPKLWEPENYWGSKMLGSSFSQADELQAFKGLKNIEFRNKVLSIVSKVEKTEGKVWNPSFGLIPKKFDFSSAIINSGNGFRFNEGVVEAKVKFRANKAITSSFSLTGNKPFPQIDVFRSGHKKVGLGIINQAGNSGVSHFVQIRGLNFNNFHIFRLEIFGNQVVWKINNHEVHRQHLDHHDGDLFLNFTGSIHHANAEGILPHHFEIEWVRCLRKK